MAETEKENKYHHGKIYRIVDNNYTMCYIGATTQKLSSRMKGHREAYRLKNRGICTVSQIFDKFGVENCKIELIEEVKCENRSELDRVEGKHIQANKCVNRCMMGIPKAEREKRFRDDNKEKIREQNKIRYEKNKTLHLEKMKKYHDEHKEEIKEYQKRYRSDNETSINLRLQEYYKNNKESILLKMAQPYTCECGITLRIADKARHQRTKRHNEIMEIRQKCT